MAVKCIYMMSIDGTAKPYGWSEVHWLTSFSTLGTDAQERAAQLAVAMMGLRPDNVRLLGIRMSLDGEESRESLFLHSAMAGAEAKRTIIPNRGALTGADNSDIPNTSVLCHYRGQSGRRRNAYVAGITDTTIRTDPPGPFLGPARSRWNAWSQILTGAPLGEFGSQNRWGFRVKDNSPGTYVPILKYERNEEGELMVVIPSVFSTIQPGNLFQIGRVLINPRGCPSPAGVYMSLGPIEDIPNNVTRYILRPVKQHLHLETIVRPGFLQRLQYDFVNYTRVDPAGQATRKRGVGSVRPVGKSRTR